MPEYLPLPFQLHYLSKLLVVLFRAWNHLGHQCRKMQELECQEISERDLRDPRPHPSCVHHHPLVEDYSVGDLMCALGMVLDSPLDCQIHSWCRTSTGANLGHFGKDFLHWILQASSLFAIDLSERRATLK